MSGRLRFPYYWDVQSWHLEIKMSLALGVPMINNRTSLSLEKPLGILFGFAINIKNGHAHFLGALGGG